MKTFNKKTFLSRLGAFLFRLRKSKGMSQDRLTDEAGLAKGLVSKIESGNVDPRTTTLVQLAHALEIPPSKMLEADKKSA